MFSRTLDHGYHAFISYSHAQDGPIAEALQRDLCRFAVPWYRYRPATTLSSPGRQPHPLRIFRDVTNLAAAPALWPSILTALEASQWLILMASPAAAQSPWVRKEVDWWLKHRRTDDLSDDEHPADRILIALTDGQLVWRDHDFDWTATDAVPLELAAVFKAEPRWVDLRPLRSAVPALSLPSMPKPVQLRLGDIVADFAAPIRGLDKDRLVGEHLQQRRRTRRTISAVIAALATLTVAATAFGLTAQQQARVATEQRSLAVARQLMAQSQVPVERDPATSLRMALAAHAIDANGETHSNLLATLTATGYAGTIATRGNQVWSLAYSPDGHTLASGDSDGTVFLWDVTDPIDPQPLANLPKAHTDDVRWLRFSPDGRTLASAGGSSVILWDATDPSRLKRRGAALAIEGSVQSMASTVNGRTLAIGTEAGDVGFWDVTNPDRPSRFDAQATGHEGGVWSLAFTPDGHTLAAGDRSGRITLWDITDLRRPRQSAAPLAAHTAQVLSLAFAPDGHTLASASSDQTVQLWDFTAEDGPRRLGGPLTRHTSAVDSVAFAPDGFTLATSSHDRTAILWDLSRKDHAQPLGAPLTGHALGVYAIAFAPDGRTLVTGGMDRTIKLWSTAAPARPSRLGPALTGHAESVLEATFAPHGRLLATADLNGKVLLWDTADPASPRQLGSALAAHTKQIRGLAFSPSGGILATGSEDHTVILWNVATPATPRQVGAPLTGHTEGVGTIAFASDRLLATAGGDDNTVILWDLTDPAAAHRIGEPLKGHDFVSSLAFTHDGRTLATADGAGTITLWDVSDPASPQRFGRPFSDHASLVTSIAFTPNGKTMATGNQDSTVILWDVTDPKRPKQLGPPLAGHRLIGVWLGEGWISSVAFFPDGLTLATGSWDRTIILWDVTDPSRPRRIGSPLTGHSDEVNAVAVASDGRTLASGGSDHSVILWDVAALSDLRAHAVDRACGFVDRGLDRDEWTRYVGDLTYIKTCS